MDKTDITIVGAGVIGLAIASQVAKPNRKVYVLDKNVTFGQEQSSRNSEVIHSPIYQKEGSLKAKLCLEGNHLLYELCEKNSIATIKCGKIIMATNDFETGEVERVFVQAKNNGTKVRWLSQKEAAQLEPELRMVSAFHSPDTGIIDPHSLMRYFLSKSRDRGAQIVYNTKLTGIEKTSDGYKVEVEDPSGRFSFISAVLINCAGLHSDKVSELAGINIDQAKYKLQWCKGEYYSVSGSSNRHINGLIYPVVLAICVGIHVCLDVNWRLRFGPLFYHVDELDYKIDDSNRDIVVNSSMLKALPFIKPSDVDPESSGIMAALQEDGEAVRDFVIQHESDRGLPGFINLVGMDSPGLTASPAIATHVSRMVDEVLYR